MIIRSEAEQQPNTPLKKSILKAVWLHFDHQEDAEKKRRAFIFERVAARIFQMHDHRVLVDEITRGGRDIAEVMINAGYNTVETVTHFLNTEFTL